MAKIGQLKEHASLLVFIVKLLDWLIICGGGWLGFLVLEPFKTFPDYTGLLPPNYLTAISLGFVFSAWWFPVFNVYKRWRGESIYEEIRTLFFSWASAMLGVLVFIVFTKTSVAFSRHWLAAWFALAFAGLVLFRIILRLTLRYLRQNGFNQRYIVLVGDGRLSRQIAEKIASSTWLGLNIVGFFSDTVQVQSVSGLKKLGSLAEMAAYVEKNAIDQVWITLPLKEIDVIEKLCHQLHTVATNVLMVPDMSSLRLLNQSVTQIDGIPIINMSVSPMQSGNLIGKWIEDKLLSLLILLLISPLLVLISLAVKLTSQGPVFYSQERISWNGKRFKMLKFRTLAVDADNQKGAPVWGGARSKQATPIGHFLRKTSMDELPQFINVLKGDMSIVGPRPERTVFVDQFKYEIDCYMKKHLVKAGITGWAQINGLRGDTCIKTRVDYDLYYIEHWSLWFDLKIILLTLCKGFVHDNAY
ncbi:MAG: undecaprenyl-phosphate glucose phosphotransferase [Methylococcales bacterium]|nr:undecaprenyl-phosphate glucose phosphotransferase [Methylococcales bacterium]